MRTQLFLAALLITNSIFAQPAELSTYEVPELEGKQHGVTALFDLDGNHHVILVTNKAFQISKTDQDFGLVEHSSPIPLPEKSESFNFYQDDENVYCVFERGSKKHFPTLGQVDKSTLDYEEKAVLDLPKGEKYLLHKFEEERLFLFTYQRKKNRVCVYEFDRFEFVKKHEYVDKKLFKYSQYLLESLSSFKVFVQKSKIYFLQKAAEKTILKTKAIVFDLDEETIHFKEYDFDITTTDIKKIKRSYNNFSSVLKKAYSNQIFNGKLIQLFRTKQHFFLNVFDLESGEIVKNEILVRPNEVSNYSVFHSEKANSFSGIFLNSTLTDQDELYVRSLKSSKFITRLSILNSGEDEALLMFGKTKYENPQEQSIGLGIVGGVFGGALGGVMLSMALPANGGLVTDFGFIKFDEATNKIQPATSIEKQLTAFSKYQFYREENAERNKRLIDKLFFTHTGLLLVSFDKRNSRFSFFK